MAVVVVATVLGVVVVVVVVMVGVDHSKLPITTLLVQVHPIAMLT